MSIEFGVGFCVLALLYVLVVARQSQLSKTRPILGSQTVISGMEDETSYAQFFLSPENASQGEALVSPQKQQQT